MIRKNLPALQPTIKRGDFGGIALELWAPIAGLCFVLAPGLGAFRVIVLSFVQPIELQGAFVILGGFARTF